jgi:tetratricopeptide (TPR) repeat protein
MIDVEEEICGRYLAAAAALARGDVETARRDFELLVLEAPRFAPAWDGLAGCWDAEGDLKKAGEYYRRAIRLDSRNWRSRLNWGSALHRAGEIKEACKWLRGAASLAPEERCIHHRLGSCHFDLGDYDEALRCYRRALECPEREITDSELYLSIGAAEMERGDLDAADEAYQKACLFAPDNPVVYHQWAVLCARQGDVENAERLAQRAVGLDRRSLRSLLLLVDLAVESGRWPDARSRIEEVGRCPGGERLATALLADLARRSGDIAAARELALKALGMDGPPSDQAVDTALATLRELNQIRTRCRGFRLVVEVDCGMQVYFRPYVVLAENLEQARWFVAELQDALDTHPWGIAETELFEHEGEALAGIYQLLLTRVLFPREEACFG